MNKRKVFAKSVILPANTPSGNQAIEIKLDDSVNRIVGFCVVETSNTNNNPYQVSLAIAGETILQPANSKLYQSNAVSPDDKFKTLDLQTSTNVVTIYIGIPTTIGASEVKFDVCLETLSV